VKALRRILGDRVDTAAFARATELLMKAAASADGHIAALMTEGVGGRPDRG
jgi:hypothetical protein